MPGIILIACGALVLLISMPAALLAVRFHAFVLASIGILLITGGWLLRARKVWRERAASPAATQVGLLAEWEIPLTIGLILLTAVWGYWFMKSSQWQVWQDKHEDERGKAPAWTHDLEEFSGGTGVAEIKKKLSREGFHMRCYSVSRERIGMEPDDKDACWTIARSAWDIPSRMIFFTFGQEGLRQIRMDFPAEQWPAVKAWFERQRGVASGTFGRDQGGNVVVGKMLSSGHLLTSAPDHLPSVMLLWQARSHLKATLCREASLKDSQWNILCREPGASSSQQSRKPDHS